MLERMDLLMTPMPPSSSCAAVRALGCTTANPKRVAGAHLALRAQVVATVVQAQPKLVISVICLSTDSH